MYQRLGKEKKDFHEIGWVRLSIRTRLKGLGSRSCASYFGHSSSIGFYPCILGHFD